MISFDEAVVLLAVRDNPRATKSELLAVLSEQYGRRAEVAVLSALLDKLATAGYVNTVSALPRGYILAPWAINALSEFNSAVESYNQVTKRLQSR